MTDRAILFIQVACCVSMGSAVIAVGFSHSAIMPVIGIVIWLGCLWILHRCWEWERQQRLLDFTLWQRCQRFEESLNYFRNAVQKERTVLGDQTCLWNARSRYLQCAMHPTGDCSQCKDRISVFFSDPDDPPELP